MQPDRTEEDRSEDVDILRVEIVPDLSVAVEHTATIDIHVLTAELEKGRCVLEGLEEAVRLPVVCIVRELDVTLDVWMIFSEENVSYLREIVYRCRCASDSSSSRPFQSHKSRSGRR